MGEHEDLEDVGRTLELRVVVELFFAQDVFIFGRIVIGTGRVGIGALDGGVAVDFLELTLEVLLEVTLFEGKGLLVVAAYFARVDDHIGGDPFVLDRSTAWEVVAGDGEFEAIFFADGDHHLYRSLAEGLLPDEDRPAGVLECAADDFAGTGTSAVDEGDDRGGGIGTLRVGIVFVVVLRVASLLAHEGAFGDKHIEEAGGLVEETAGVVAQVKDDPLGARVIGEGFLDVGSDVGIKRGDVDVEDILLLADGFGLDRLDFDDVADDFDLERFGFIFADDGQHGGGFGLAAHEFDRFVDGHPQRHFGIDLEDDVSGFDSGFFGGGVVDGGDDGEGSLFHAHHDPKPAKFPFGLDVEVFEGFGIHVGGMGIEVGHESFEGFVDEGGGVDLIDVLVFDHVEDLGKLQVRLKLAFAGFGLGTLFGMERRWAEGHSSEEAQGKPSSNDFFVFGKHTLVLSIKSALF